MEILNAQVSTFVHITEDSRKVLRCLDNLMPFEYELEETKTIGQYGNPIRIFRSTIKKRHIDELFTHLIEGFDKKDMGSLIEKLEDRLDKGSLYVRMDKDNLFNGIFKLGKGVQIIINCTSYPFDKEEIINGLKARFEGV